MRRIISVFLASFYAVTAFAVVKPAGIFTDSMVLQRGEDVRVWGTAEAGEKVTVAFAGQIKDAVAGKDGRWMVTLAKMDVCTQGRPLVFKGSATAQPVELKDVLVGEVWLGGGQSNMDTGMAYYRKTTQPDITSANDPLLRMLTIPRLEYAGQNTNCPQWRTTTPQTVAGFSACAYYFAKNLRGKLNIPVGIINCSVGATPAEAWMSRKTMESSADLKRILGGYEKVYRKAFATDEEYRKYYDEYMVVFNEFLRKLAAGEPAGPHPQQKMGPMNYRRPCGLHETMLSQVIPFTIRGVIWYQGENNANDQAGFHYRTVFPALIQEWRQEFQRNEMPFLFVQLATYGPARDETPLWPELRESQSWTEDNVRNAGMIVLVDGGELDNIHPFSKDKAGYRLSLLARNMVYGEKDLVCRGPRVKAKKCEKGIIKLTFKDTGSGLELKPEAISAFEVCGKDGKYVPAEAKLVDGKIIVSAKSVSEPQNARYGWRKWFVPTLFNKEGLPASPFRTDDFPLVTKDRYYLDKL